MNEILVYGHKNPDTDSVTSSYVMANLQNKLGKNAKACVLGKLNKETKYIFNYLNLNEPELIDNVEGRDVILVDHNEFSQSADGVEKANIKMVVDHHRIANFQTAEPLYYRAEPVGCTETILAKMYKENGVEITKEIAVLMISGIVSDTLLFKSPTCTKEDIEIANELAEKFGIDIQKYGLDMLKAGTDLADVCAKDLINLDAKPFDMNGLNVKIAQVSTADINDMLTRKEEIENAMQEEINENNIDLFFVAITDIINSNSQVIALGKNVDLVEKSFNVKLENNTAFLEGVVSRKKQIVPVLQKNA